MSEKFNLKWNDFQSNVSRTFSLLRQEKQFLDVTLVTEDQRSLEAHKLVLSACSTFFNNILTHNNHSHPLLCLDGVRYEELQSVLDYIYLGEVQICQEKLDRFLKVAEKLQLAGLVANGEEKVPSEDTFEDFKNVTTELKTKEARKRKTSKRISQSFPEQQDIKPIVLADNLTDLSEVTEKINENLIENGDGTLSCGVCGKMGDADNKRQKYIMQRHLETHLEGLSYPCQACGKTFRSKNSLNCHVSTFHRR